MRRDLACRKRGAGREHGIDVGHIRGEARVELPPGDSRARRSELRDLVSVADFSEGELALRDRAMLVARERDVARLAQAHVRRRGSGEADLFGAPEELVVPSEEPQRPLVRVA
jgi:hypothetical protein